MVAVVWQCTEYPVLCISRHQTKRAFPRVSREGGTVKHWAIIVALIVLMAAISINKPATANRQFQLTHSNMVTSLNQARSPVLIIPTKMIAYDSLMKGHIREGLVGNASHNSREKNTFIMPCGLRWPPNPGQVAKRESRP